MLKNFASFSPFTLLFNIQSFGNTMYKQLLIDMYYMFDASFKIDALHNRVIMNWKHFVEYLLPLNPFKYR